jgi:arylsulfatase
MGAQTHHAKEATMPDRPNLIFLMPDQLRHDFLGCYGAEFLKTPNIDFLADHGVLFERSYSAHPVCVPARVSLITGMHALRTGVLDNGGFLRPDYRECGISTWPELLNERGYYTAAIGKMHFYPWDLRLGFQYRNIAEDKRWLYVRDDYWHFLHRHGHRKYHGREHEGYFENRGAIIDLLPWELQVDHFVGQEACRFIREHGAEGPFAMMVGFPGPHCPYDPAPEFLADIDPEKMPPPVPEAPGDTPRIRQQNIEGNKRDWNGVDYTEFTDEHKKKIRAHYAAEVEQIDQQVGEILNALREKGLLDNTVIIFSSDHGDYLGDHNLIGKGQYYEASTHVPMIVYVPWLTEAQRCDELVTLTDVTATMLAFAGVDVPAFMDSQPMPCLGLPAGRGRERVIGALGGGWSIYDGRLRLSKYATGEVTLFDLQADPTEQRNLVRDPDHAEALLALDAELTRAVMDGMRDAHHDRRVYVHDLSQDPGFGKEGWQRPYPRAYDNRA